MLSVELLDPEVEAVELGERVADGVGTALDGVIVNVGLGD